METEQVRKEMRKAETDMQDHKHAVRSWALG